MATLHIHGLDEETLARLRGRAAQHGGRRREMGRPMSDLDGQIAAIASARGFAIATRNIKDFDNCGLNLINPFDA